IPVTIRDIQFVGDGVGIDLRGAPEIQNVIAAVMRTLLADLQEKFPLLIELQNLRVRVSISANPDVAFVVAGDAVIAFRPLVSGPRTSPGVDQVSGVVKFQNRSSPLAAHADWWSAIRTFEIVFNGPRPMDDPDVVLR